MPVSSSLYIPFTAAAAVTVAAAAAAFTLWNQHRNDSDSIEPEKQSHQVAWRDLLPNNLNAWRRAKNPKDCLKQWDQTWNTLRPLLHARGYTLWERLGRTLLVSPGYPRELDVSPELRKSYGFGYVLPDRANAPDNHPGSIRGLCRMNYRNGLYRAASSHNREDVVIRVIAIKKEGQEHLDILRKIGTGPNSFYSTNHCLPLLEEIQLEDIIFGVFPKVGQSMFDAYGLTWPKNSVGDVLEMIIQMLEALEFIHSINIAHRDSFQDNFVVQWHPESMLTNKISSTRPRVYLIDFEAAVQFPQEYDERQCFMSGLPLGGSFSVENVDGYSRPRAPECVTGELYSPFKLDVWQLGQSLLYFKSGISSIDDTLKKMTEPNSAARLSASDTLNKLTKIVHAMTPESLLVDPQQVDDI